MEIIELFKNIPSLPGILEGYPTKVIRFLKYIIGVRAA